MPDDAPLFIDTEKLFAASDKLLGCGDAVFAVAPKIREDLPYIPEDRYDVLKLMGQFEDRRSQFDRAVSETWQSAAARLADYALDASSADGSSPFVNLPAVAGPPDAGKGR